MQDYWVFIWIRQFIDWLGQFIESNPWPATVLILFIIFVSSPWIRFLIVKAFRALGLKRLKFSGTEIEFGEYDKEVVQQTFEESIALIEQYRKKIDNKIGRLVRKFGLQAALNELAKTVFEEQFGDKYGDDGSKLRMTIHVQDYVFDDRLYQLTDYFPTGKGAYRHFSLRRGVIGRVWRSELPQSAGFLTYRTAPPVRPLEEELVKQICREWGLMETEAVDFKRRPSYCCVPIMKEKRLLGVLYFDSIGDNFGWDGTEEEIKEKLNALENRCTALVGSSNIPSILCDIEKEMADYATRKSLDA